MNKPENIISRLAAAVIITAAVAACSVDGKRGNGDDNYFSAFQTVDPAGWDYADHVQFRVDTLRDSVSRKGTMVVSLRHTHGYEYSNIWLELSTPVNDSIRLRDTLNIRLADSYGHWLGKGIGPSLTVSDTVATPYDLSCGQTLTLRHIMRTDTLAGIEQVGIVFLPND
ncbi:MAG: gliding motility lipoprotein GldH [Muribaculaceae bacterium]|nr:gliding motility lipoprotein GldH [Muribaculaceae bacterium]MDE6135450.1 gliding motility lipoprotein GldH [Muribaculaceae bacterium]